MRVLIILKYIPSESDHQKSDLLRSTIIGHIENGHDVCLLSTGRSDEHPWCELTVSLNKLERRVKRILKRFPRLSSVYTANRIATRVKHEHQKRPIDVMLAESTGNTTAVWARAISRKTHIPYVIREHHSYDKKYRSSRDVEPDYLRALRDAEAVVAVSPLLSEIMREMQVRQDVGCIPNSISDEFFEAPETVEPFKEWAGESFLFAGWTRWREFKRVDLLLRAFKQLYETGTDTKLLIAGPIEPESNCRWAANFIQENGLQNVVKLYGSATRAEIHQLAHATDCCVVPSDYETFGLPALESIAAGKPVVATRCNGPEYIINSEKLGRIVTKGDPVALAGAMRDVLQNYHGFDSRLISSNARSRFARKAVAQQFSDLYRQVTDHSYGSQ